MVRKIKLFQRYHKALRCVALQGSGSIERTHLTTANKCRWAVTIASLPLYLRETIGCSFFRLTRVQNILSADTCTSRQIDRHSFGDHLISGSVSQCYAIEYDRGFYCALFYGFMTRVSQCPISLLAEHPLAPLPIWVRPRTDIENRKKKRIVQPEIQYRLHGRHAV
jgi:hypothetical protein